jgi:hypothetical protein
VAEGASVRQIDVRRDDPTLRARIEYAFGSWREAMFALARSLRRDDPTTARCLLAELAPKPRPPRRPKRPRPPPWDRQRVLDAIHARQRDGQALAASSVPNALYIGAWRTFGSWSKALEAAGIDPLTVRLRPPRHTEAGLITWLRQLAREHPAWTIAQVIKAGGPALSCARRWGSIEAAARAAGIEGWPTRTKRDRMTHDEIIAELRRLHQEQVPLNLSHVRETLGMRRLVHGVKSTFSSWDDAIAAAGLPPVRRNHVPWTRAAAISRLEIWHREGVALHAKEIRGRDASFYNALRDLFGTLAAAMRAAGLPYRPIGNRALGLVRPMTA